MRKREYESAVRCVQRSRSQLIPALTCTYGLKMSAAEYIYQKASCLSSIDDPLLKLMLWQLKAICKRGDKDYMHTAWLLMVKYLKRENHVIF